MQLNYEISPFGSPIGVVFTGDGTVTRVKEHVPVTYVVETTIEDISTIEECENALCHVHIETDDAVTVLDGPLYLEDIKSQMATAVTGSGSSYLTERPFELWFETPMMEYEMNHIDEARLNELE